MSNINPTKSYDFVRIYTDFDGTISKQDIINTILDRYADPIWLELDEKYLSGKISSRECLSKQIALLQDVPNEKILEIAREVGIDESFKSFCSFCLENKIDIEIVSDGLDIYINHLLKLNGIVVKKINSNIYRGNGIIEFPYNKHLCDKNCANCKKSHFDDKSFIVFIGDGKNDICAAMNSDLIFAKGSLANYLKTNGKDYYHFDSFLDIINILRDLFSREHLKRSHNHNN